MPIFKSLIYLCCSEFGFVVFATIGSFLKGIGYGGEGDFGLIGGGVNVLLVLRSHSAFSVMRRKAACLLWLINYERQKRQKRGRVELLIQPDPFSQKRSRQNFTHSSKYEYVDSINATSGAIEADQLHIKLPNGKEIANTQHFESLGQA